MTGPVSTDTAHMAMVAQKSLQHVENIIGHATTMRNGIEFALNSSQGQTAGAWRQNMEKQKADLDKLIAVLNKGADVVKQGGQGFDTHDTDGSSSVTTAGQGFLSTPLNI